MEKRLIPEIRFKGFNGKWKEDQFENLVSRVSSRSTDEDLPRIEFEDINSGLRTLNKDVYKKDNKEKSGIHFKEGNVLFGKLRPYLKNWYYPNFEGVAVGDFWVFKTKEKIDSKFLYNLIQAEKFGNISNLSTGTKMPRSDWKLVSKTFFGVPENDEQEKIGRLFERLDQTIDLQGKVLEENKRLKQALLQKLFPQKGQKLPALRLKGFSGDWERKKLGELTIKKIKI